MTLDYGIIGNCRTAALVKQNASIEWCCFPRFDSPSVFAKLLDPKGGSFEIIPLADYKTRQSYVEKTNVLETVFYNPENKFSVTDYFPLYTENNKLQRENSIHRIIRPLKGTPQVRILFDPKFNYAMDKGEIIVGNKSICAESGYNRLYLYSNLDPEAIVLRRPVELDADKYLVLNYNKQGHYSVEALLKRTINYWRGYMARHIIPEMDGREHVIRSILALKLMTYAESGAIIAAPTTSIPEIIGETRNWDYRYCWLRDASLAVDAFTKVCSFEETEKFLEFLMKVCRTCSVRGIDLQVMYGVEGETDLRERKLDHFQGYKGSGPVHVGNGAFSQIQIDVVGELIDAMYQFFVTYHYVHKMTDTQFDFIRSLVNYTIKNWMKKDHSIWEFRTIKEHFVFSKMMCWVALDRAIKIAEHYNKECPIEEWKKTRDEIRQEILEKGWSGKKKAFVMYYGAEDLDASVLLMYHYDFISPKDPRYVSSVKAIENELLKDGLLYRYNMRDDFGRQKNAFTTVSFWLVDALYMIGEKEKALKMFRNLLNHANHVDLFSEDIDLRTKELTGNFPQAYTHISLINSAVLLNHKGLAKRPVCMPSMNA